MRQRHAAVQPPPPAPRRRRRRGVRGSAERRLGRGLLRLAARAAPAPALGAPRRGRRQPRGLRGHFPGVGGGGRGGGGWRREERDGRAAAAAAAGGPQRALRAGARAARARGSITPRRAAPHRSAPPTPPLRQRLAAAPRRAAPPRPGRGSASAGRAGPGLAEPRWGGGSPPLPPERRAAPGVGRARAPAPRWGPGGQRLGSAAACGGSRA